VRNKIYDNFIAPLTFFGSKLIFTTFNKFKEVLLMFPTDNFESEFTFENSARSLSEEPPFHFLMLGDWSGNFERVNLNTRRPFVVDRDNFDEVIKKLKVGLEIDLNGDGKDFLRLEFAELDDFHPDSLFRRVSLFSELRDVRRRLSNSDTFDEAANEVRSWFYSPDDKTFEETSNSSDINDTPFIDSNNLLDEILAKPNDSSASVKLQRVENTELGRFVSKIVSPFLIKIDENEQSELIAAVDETISRLMRSILHHPKFQALESAWRGLYFLVRRAETDVDLKIFILDVSKDELIENLKSTDSLADSFLYRWLIDETIETPGGEAYSFIGGNYTFNIQVEDIAALMRISKLASAANAPFISHVLPEIFGIKSFAEKIDSMQFKFSEDSSEGKLWTTLRLAADSNYIGLSPMRILARLPFGVATDSTETFSFEEFTENNKHDQFLWTNPCFAIGLLFAQSYRLYGWEMGKALVRDIEKLPVYLFQENGETKTKPCGEVVLTEKFSEMILEQGLIPLISFRDTDKVKAARFQSVSFSQPQLSGRWNS